MTMPSYSDNMYAHFMRLRARFGRRDQTHALVHGILQGNMRQLFPSELNFNLSFDGSPTENFIKSTAEDFGNVMSPLPSLKCVSGGMKTDADMKRAEMKNRIGNYYWTNSSLPSSMNAGAQRYCAYGFLPFFVEPDNDRSCPFIQVMDPRHSYYELDRYGRPRVFMHRWLRAVDDLVAMYPTLESAIRMNPKTKTKDQGEIELEMVLHVDKTRVSLFLPTRSGLILDSYAHKLDRLPVWIAEMPHEGDYPRGKFDDVVWIQVARAIMGTLALEAASLAVQAPIAVPDDMNEFPVGAHALLQSENANQIHRVALELPPTIFAENQNLDDQMKRGAGVPDARTGGVDASVITGKGVEALMGQFDSQIKGSQMIFAKALEEITSICFEYDVAWWPNTTKTIQGIGSAGSYEFSYTPSKDIGDRTKAQVTYGFAAGMAPAQSNVVMLQLEGAGLIAKDTVRENLIFDIDPLEEERRIGIEATREALKTGLFSLLQNAGPMALQGADPLPFMKMATSAVRNLQGGQTVENAIASAFEQMEQAQQQAQAAAQAAQGQAAPGQEGPPDQQQDQGQPGAPPDTGPPDMQQVIAGFRGQGNSPVMSAVVKRQQPVAQ